MDSSASALAQSLRRFCLGAFAFLARELEEGAELPFSFEEHRSPGRPSLYEYRPLAKAFVEARAEPLAAIPDTTLALEELRLLPQARIFSRAHTGGSAGAVGGSTAGDPLFRAVLLPLVVQTAEAVGGFDWDDEGFDASFQQLERSLFGSERRYSALAPLVGLSAPAPIELGSAVLVRMAEPGELASLWPEAGGLLPRDFGREPDRLCVLQCERPLSAEQVEAPDAPGELTDAVTALRLATAGPIAAGPVAFERLDGRPYGIRPVLPIAATQPAGEATRLDVFRGRLARDLLTCLAAAETDAELGEALDRWELSLFQEEPFRSEQLRQALTGLLGGQDGAWAAALRAAVLLGETGNERGQLLSCLRSLVHGEAATPDAADAVRRSLVETLVYRDRGQLVQALDETLLGLRPRPRAAFAARAAV